MRFCIRPIDGAFKLLAIMDIRAPVDLAAVHRDVDNVSWASNTTLDDGSDFYVANRGDNTIVRMRQNGSVVAVRRVGRLLSSAKSHHPIVALGGEADTASPPQIGRSRPIATLRAYHLLWCTTCPQMVGFFRQRGGP